MIIHVSDSIEESLGIPRITEKCDELKYTLDEIAASCDKIIRMKSSIFNFKNNIRLEFNETDGLKLVFSDKSLETIEDNLIELDKLVYEATCKLGSIDAEKGKICQTVNDISKSQK